LPGKVYAGIATTLVLIGVETKKPTGAKLFTINKETGMIILFIKKVNLLNN
jgi:hypothetical protein